MKNTTGDHQAQYEAAIEATAFKAGVAVERERVRELLRTWVRSALDHEDFMQEFEKQPPTTGGISEEAGRMAYHWKDGWHFEKLENGSVRIYHIEPGVKPEIADEDIEIDAASWHDLVEAVS